MKPPNNGSRRTRQGDGSHTEKRGKEGARARALAALAVNLVLGEGRTLDQAFGHGGITGRLETEQATETIE